MIALKMVVFYLFCLYRSGWGRSVYPTIILLHWLCCCSSLTGKSCWVFMRDFLIFVDCSPVYSKLTPIRTKHFFFRQKNIQLDYKAILSKSFGSGSKDLCEHLNINIRSLSSQIRSFRSDSEYLMISTNKDWVSKFHLANKLSPRRSPVTVTQNRGPDAPQWKPWKLSCPSLNCRLSECLSTKSVLRRFIGLSGVLQSISVHQKLIGVKIIVTVAS